MPFPESKAIPLTKVGSLTWIALPSVGLVMNERIASLLMGMVAVAFSPGGMQ